MEYEITIKAVKKDKRCYGCHLTANTETDCGYFLAGMEAFGLPSCDDGYVYIKVIKGE